MGLPPSLHPGRGRKAQTAMVHDEAATDVRFLATGPNSFGMATNGSHYAGQPLPGTATAGSEAENPASPPVAEPAEGPAEDDSERGSGYPAEGFSIEKLLEAAANGNISEYVRMYAPKPCPAALAIRRFVLKMVLEVAEEEVDMAIESGAMGAAMKAFTVMKWVENSVMALEKVAEDHGLTDTPILEFNTLHALLSMADPAWLCQMQKDAAEAKGFPLDTATATVREFLEKMPTHKERAETLR